MKKNILDGVYILCAEVTLRRSFNSSRLCLGVFVEVDLANPAENQKMDNDFSLAQNTLNVSTDWWSTE